DAAEAKLGGQHQPRRTAADDDHVDVKRQG
ncbi:MAG: hypothetical protein JWM17_2753, partial [Actinobacteria bacterium]|nr:hypothetical protein [Actinomycetota bacterium]